VGGTGGGLGRRNESVKDWAEILRRNLCLVLICSFCGV
jgi:hypothetical protein